MYDKLKSLKLELSAEKKLLFSRFTDLFLEYNSKVNLISNNDEKVLFEKHIFDSLAFNLFNKKYCDNEKLNIMDIGTGGGFPSLPIAINYDDCNVVGVDSINKKINFIKWVSEELKLKNINPICSRVEDLPYNYRASFDVVVSRAMADLRMILEYSVPFIKVGGYFVAYKSIKADEEIEKAKSALKILNCEIVDKIGYTLPIDVQNKRVLLVIKKTQPTKLIYPRKNGQVKKTPL